MNLIALLIGLAIERLATQIFHWRRMRWLDRIIDIGFRQADQVAIWPAVIPVILLGIVLVLPVAGVIWFLGDALAGFAYLLLAVVVLFFSLGPHDIGEDVAAYCRALEADDDEQVHNAAKAIVEDDVPDDAVERTRLPFASRPTTGCSRSYSGSSYSDRWQPGHIVLLT